MATTWKVIVINVFTADLSDKFASPRPVWPQVRWFSQISISSNLFANPSCSHLVVLDDLKRSGDNKAEAVNALPSVVEQVPRGATQQSLNQIQYIKYKRNKIYVSNINISNIKYKNIRIYIKYKYIKYWKLIIWRTFSAQKMFLENCN